MYFADPVASQVLDRMRISRKDSDVIFRCGKAWGNSGHLLTPLYGHSVTDFPVQVAANSLCCSGCPALAARRMAAFRRLSVSPMSFENSGRRTVRAHNRRIEPQAVRFRKTFRERGGGGGGEAKGAFRSRECAHHRGSVGRIERNGFECGLDLLRQIQLHCCQILGQMRDIGRAGDQQHVRCARQQPCKRQLHRRSA